MEKEIMISYQYFKMVNAETRSFLRDMRRRLDELERVCDAACDGAASDIVAQSDMALSYENGDEGGEWQS